MAYNTKAIKTDVNQKPIPQIYNPVTDEYEVLQGANGAARHIIYGADGNPITTSGNKLAVRATEIETMLTTIGGYLDGLEPTLGTPAADPAANTVLARLKTLATLVGEVQDVPTANTLLSRIKSLETKLGEVQAIPTANTLLARIKSIEDKLTAGIPLSGSNAPLPYVEETIISTATEVLNGATYESASKNGGGYRYVNAFFKLSAKPPGNVVCYIVHRNPVQYITDSATIDTSLDYQTILDKSVKAKSLGFRVLNDSGVTISILKLGYFVQ